MLDGAREQVEAIVVEAEEAVTPVEACELATMVFWVEVPEFEPDLDPELEA